MSLFHRQIAAVWLLEQTPIDHRKLLLKKLNLSDKHLAISWAPSSLSTIKWSNNLSGPPIEIFKNTKIKIALWPNSKFILKSSKNEKKKMAFRLTDGSILISETPHIEPRFFFGPLVMTFIFMVFSLIILSLWAFNGIIRPLRRFSTAVEEFGKDGVAFIPFKEQGPDELRRSARAFNSMQQRINHLITDRTRMLTAVGHDLLTPITRLKLRAEYIINSELQESFVADLNHMQLLLQGAMIYLRDGKSGEKTASIDLSILLQTISDQWSDAGVDIPLIGSKHIYVNGRQLELLRLFGNLTENAVKHAHSISINVRADAGHAIVMIIDHGPGILKADKIKMLAPFTRGDDARNMDDKSGLGLGLAICKAIVKSHKGSLNLQDTPTGGLTVEVKLPLAD